MKRTILTLQITALSLRGLSHIIRLWPFALLLWCMLAEVSTHVLVRGSYGYYDYGDCLYFGGKGLQQPSHATGCPLLILINTSTGDVP